MNIGEASSPQGDRRAARDDEARSSEVHCVTMVCRPFRLLVASSLLLALSAHGAVIYRWVDEAGRTHVSDVVPERYQSSATRMDSSSSEIPAAQRQQAERAAAKNKALAAETDASRQGATAVQASSPTASAPATAKRPAQAVTDATDCETWRRLYQESMACFAPFRTANGTTKSEAFEQCNPISSPELKCGPVRD